MIVVIDYGLGNLGSMLNMLKRVGARAEISSEHTIIGKADKLILPGVGSFDAGIKNLSDRKMIPLLEKRVLEDKVPILGVCLGMQLMSMGSEEGNASGLGWLNAETKRFKFEEPLSTLKIPHMGWNQLSVRQKHPLFESLDIENRFYFVHSYHLTAVAEENIFAETRYGYDFTSVVVKDNILGVQFHPEKSHKYGMCLLNNYVKWT